MPNYNCVQRSGSVPLSPTKIARIWIVCGWKLNCAVRMAVLQTTDALNCSGRLRILYILGHFFISLFDSSKQMINQCTLRITRTTLWIGHEETHRRPLWICFEFKVSEWYVVIKFWRNEISWGVVDGVIHFVQIGYWTRYECSKSWGFRVSLSESNYFLGRSLQGAKASILLHWLYYSRKTRSFDTASDVTGNFLLQVMIEGLCVEQHVSGCRINFLFLHFPIQFTVGRNWKKAGK